MHIMGKKKKKKKHMMKSTKGKPKERRHKKKKRKTQKGQNVWEETIKGGVEEGYCGQIGS